MIRGLRLSVIGGAIWSTEDVELQEEVFRGGLAVSCCLAWIGATVKIMDDRAILSMDIGLLYMGSSNYEWRAYTGSMSCRLARNIDRSSCWVCLRVLALWFAHRMCSSHNHTHQTVA